MAHLDDIDALDVPPISSPRPPTDEERREMLATLEELRRGRAAILAVRGGKFYPNSWEQFPDLDDEMDAALP